MLITVNDVTKEFNASGQNLDALLKLNKMSRDEVATQIALSAFDEIEKSKLGWSHSIKKFFFPTATYGGILSLPIIGMVSCLWYFVQTIQNLTSVNGWAIGGGSFGVLLGADAALGKVFGTRPMTAILIATYDFYREGAKALSKQVRESYTNEETRFQELIKARHETIKTELKTTYKEMALELVNRFKKNSSTVSSAVKTLNEQLPNLKKGLTQLGLSDAETVEVLQPIRDALDMIAKAMPSPKNPAAAAG